jgi:hypothetical protein
MEPAHFGATSFAVAVVVFAGPAAAASVPELVVVVDEEPGVHMEPRHFGVVAVSSFFVAWLVTLTLPPAPDVDGVVVVVEAPVVDDVDPPGDHAELDHLGVGGGDAA